MAELIIAGVGLAVALPSFIECIQKLGKDVLHRIQSVEKTYQGQYDLVVKVNQSQTIEIMTYFLATKKPIPETLEDDLLSLFRELRGIYEDLADVFPAPKPNKQPTKLSKHKSKIADAKLAKLEDWNGRFLKRAIVFTLFGQRAGSQQYLKGSTALKTLERLQETVTESLEKARLHSDQLVIRNPEPVELVKLPCSDVYRLQPRDPTSAVFLAEHRVYSDNAPAQEIEAHRKIVREIAGILRHADPTTMGMLHCRGFLHVPLENRLELHFDYPPGYSTPRTLLGLLTDPETRRSGAKHPLGHRISLAKKIVSALFVLHSADLVHKQVRPDNILIFEKTPDSSLAEPEKCRQLYPYALGEPFLVGFDAVRKVDAASMMLHVEDWRKNIYLSPERHRLQSGDQYRIQHDLYSLGVVLLEIAFWASFSDRKPPALGGRLWKNGITMRAPEELKKIYLSLASGAVPRLMGEKFADVIKACLSGLKDKVDDKSLEDADGIVVGAAYITEIIRGLEDIVV